eukprot:353478-Chlamydomonas_euryale.AAC.3
MSSPGPGTPSAALKHARALVAQSSCSELCSYRAALSCKVGHISSKPSSQPRPVVDAPRAGVQLRQAPPGAGGAAAAGCHPRARMQARLHIRGGRRRHRRVQACAQVRVSICANGDGGGGKGGGVGGKNMGRDGVETGREGDERGR